HRIETAVQLKVRIRRVQGRMIEQVECVGFVLQVETLVDLEVLEDREVETGLKRRPEHIATRRPESGLLSVANIEASCRSVHLARGHTVLPGGQQRQREGVRIHVRLIGESDLGPATTGGRLCLFGYNPG